MDNSENKLPPLAEALFVNEFNNLVQIFQSIASKELTGQATSCVPEGEEVH